MALSASLLIAVGCSPDNDFGATSSVKISGTVLRSDDTPAEGAKITLRRGDTVVTSAKTDAQGAYSFLIDQSDVQRSAAGIAVAYTLEMSLDVSGGTAEIALDFAATLATMQVPGMRFLEVPAGVTQPSSAAVKEVVVAVPNYGDGDDRDPKGYALEVLTADGKLLASKETGPSAPAINLNRAFLEDFATTWRIKALLEIDAAGTTFVGYAAGLPASLPALNAAPISRGLSCAYSNSASPTPTTLTPCPITDGNLNTAFERDDPICVDDEPDDGFDLCAPAVEKLTLAVGGSLILSTIAVHDTGDLGEFNLVVGTDQTCTSSGAVKITGDSFLRSFDTPMTAYCLSLEYSGSSTSSLLSGLNEIVIY